ncbi:MAG: OmpA family protein [Runella sp.]
MAHFAANPQVHEYPLKVFAPKQRLSTSYSRFFLSKSRFLLPILLLYLWLQPLSYLLGQTHQNVGNTPKKAVEALEKSTKFYQERNFEKASLWADEALKQDSLYAEAHLRKAQLYEVFTQSDLALRAYRRAVMLKPKEATFAFAYQKLIDYHLKRGDYTQAKYDLEQYLTLLKPGSVAHKRAALQLQTCLYGEEAIKNPLVIEPEELSDTINRFFLQYFPSLTADTETLVFTALKPENDEDIFITTFKEGQWSSPVSISDKINTNENEGTAAISADGRTLVFTACNRRDGYGSCDLYISRKIGDEWQRPQNLGININSPYWESQPTLSSDGRTIYFVSDRKGGVGGRDLWSSTLLPNGQWTPAQNAGNILNTPSDEASPFLHANGHTLFFASEGHQGLGGYDLFFSDSTYLGWQKPRNLGYPINTAANEVALTITADGLYGYYSLDKKLPDNQRISRLYRFLLPETLKQQFEPAHYLKGFIKDALTQKPIKADIELIDLSTNKTLQRLSSDPTTGEYLTTLPNGVEWGLYVTAAGYFYKSYTFDYTQYKGKTIGYRRDIELDPIKANSFGVLNNIYFETGKADLQEKSRSELNKLIQILKQQPTLRIQIIGHTDDVGDAKQNQVLSHRRAQSVKDYLVKEGINPERLKALGMGKSKPIVPNTTEENRQLNRRIEWSIW